MQQYTLEELQHKLYHKVYEVYDIFKNFFGEEYVDLQRVMEEEELRTFLRVYIEPQEGVYELSENLYTALKNNLNSPVSYPQILVWWPEVRVTNEFDKHVDIQDLYAKIQLTLDGGIPYENHGFQLTRSTFSIVQYSSGYIHSHIPRFRDGVPEFSNPCYGNGPIKETINTLKVGQDEASWLLFCQELSLYVTVESIAGIPYFRMENIGESSIIDTCTGNLDPPQRENLDSLDNLMIAVPDFQDKMRSFVKYYLEQGTLKLCFINGEYRCGLSYYDFIISISNAFISWFNSYGDSTLLNILYYNKIIYPCQIKEGKIYSAQSESYANAVSSNQRLFTFKGHDVTLKVISNGIGEESISTVLRSDFAKYLLSKIIKLINYRHAKSINQRTGNIQSAAPSRKNVIYL